MASWGDIERAEPDFAARVRSRFDAYRHKVLATLRRDGAPRISGIETSFDRGEVWLGMMKGSRKALDLQRDPRMAVHSGTEDPNEDEVMAGVVVDAKLSGRAVEVRDEATLRRVQGIEGGDLPEAHLFRVDIEEVVLIAIGDPADHLLIESWDPHRGLRARKRY